MRKTKTGSLIVRPYVPRVSHASRIHRRWFVHCCSRSGALLRHATFRYPLLLPVCRWSTKIVFVRPWCIYPKRFIPAALIIMRSSKWRAGISVTPFWRPVQR